MKTKEGYYLRTVGSESIIMASAEENVDFTRIISLNESAARLWKEVCDKENFTIEELVGYLTGWYEVDDTVARKDAGLLVKAWLDAGIIEE